MNTQAAVARHSRRNTTGPERQRTRTRSPPCTQRTGPTDCTSLDRLRSQGREALREAFATSIANWRELDFELDRALYGESFYVWQATLHGVLENPLELGAVTLPANGVSLAFAGLDVITLTDDGLIESRQTHFDLVAAANQAAQATV